MAKHKNPKKPTKETMLQNQNLENKPDMMIKPPSWAVMRGIFACKDLQTQQQRQQMQHNKQKQTKQPQREPAHAEVEAAKKCKKMKCSGSLCSNTKVMHRPELGSSPQVHKKRAIATSSSSNDTASSSRSLKSAPLHDLNGSSTTNSSFSSSSSSVGSSFRGMPFRRFSGCYECRMVVDPVLGFTRDPSLRATICSCPQCGEIFMKPESLELHQAVRHAVSELGPEDTSKNIVEIIFQSSWLKKESPICKIDRILKVHNTQRTITRFEEYRESIKGKASRVGLGKKQPRCVADGNELLRFHCATLACSLGLNGSSNLCNSIPQCGACSIIKNGFRLPAGESESGILTTATSGKAHDKAAGEGGGEKRAMLVCRVIAGRVNKTVGPVGTASREEYDSVGAAFGVYSNLDELYVFNPKAILPCFVVIYTGF